MESKTEITTGSYKQTVIVPEGMAVRGYIEISQIKMMLAVLKMNHRYIVYRNGWNEALSAVNDELNKLEGK
jgi:hypothetical protein